jgi:hypothetical protein
MKNLEQIDEYLANRMTDEQRDAFEAQVQADPELKAEVEMQTQIVEAIRAARMQELKGMLQRVPVETGILPISNRSVFRIAAGVAGIGVLIAATFYYIKTNRTIPLDSLSTDVTKQMPLVNPVQKTDATTDQQVEIPKKEPVKIEREAARVEPAQKPAFNVVDPSQELTEESAPVVPNEAAAPRNTVTVTDMRVAVDRANSKYAFHYQFESGALRLYGPFDNGLFEVLEVQGETRSLFLFYQNSYYGLSEQTTQITRLEPVRNADLLQLLREYHKR